MIPVDLIPRTLRLPPKSACSIVIMTGTERRHERFALRLQQEFKQFVIGWFQIARRASAGPPNKPKGPPTLQEQVEERMFGDELRQLRNVRSVEPTVVSDPNSAAVVALVRSLNPYLFLSLGGPIYSEPLLECARGLALNQHAGWSPDYKGSNTVEWTLYHRDIARLGNTVHILTSGVDAGPILRRSSACVMEDDTRESCFARVVALGTELMCEAVAEIIRSDKITVYDQPPERGRTYRGAELTDEITQAVESDLERGWLRTELSRLQKW